MSKELKNKELRIKVDQELFDKIEKERGLIKQNTYLGALVEKAIEKGIEVR